MGETKIQFINRLLLSNFQAHQSSYETWAVFVHASVLENLKSVWNKFFINSDWKIFEYPLQIGNLFFDIRIIYVTLRDEERETLFTFIDKSQFCFPWEDRPTLFVEVRSFKVLQAFIENHNLQSYVAKIKKQRGISGNSEMITVVTFNESVNEVLDIIIEYEYYLRSTDMFHKRPQYYYMAHAFLWLQPNTMQQTKIAKSDEFYSVFYIIFNHMRKRDEFFEVNLFDLLSTRLALCDVRHPIPSINLKYEIDCMIQVELAKTVQNNHIDVQRYAIDRNCAPTDLLIDYFIYEFQNYFTTFSRNSNNFVIHLAQVTKVRSTIELVREPDILKKIKQKSNIEFDIDGLNYNGMCFSLFLDLIECENIRQIRLDTNRNWIHNVCNPNRVVANPKGIYVRLTGPNMCNFVEDFVSSLKLMTLSKGKLSLRIYCEVQDYSIFDGLEIYRIEFKRVYVDTKMLISFRNLKSTFSFRSCTFESTHLNWARLFNLKRLKRAEFEEDEKTWLSLFEHILEYQLISNSNEFQLSDGQKTISVLYGNRKICLVNILFVRDELNAKLELKRNNEIIDLYYEKHGLKPDDKSIYGFYQ